MSRTTRAKLHPPRQRVFVFGSEALSKAVQGDRETVALIKTAPRLDIPIVTSALTALEAGDPRDTSGQALWNWTLSRIRVAPTDEQVVAMARAMLRAAGLQGHKYAIDAVLAAVAGREAAQGVCPGNRLHLRHRRPASTPRGTLRASREGLTGSRPRREGRNSIAVSSGSDGSPEGE
ncbi:hypothetical protein [Streptomyces sp. NPDC101237]|uniref:hypothetical protein n=1 Tax=Streptomyces sp. NPDC101237 TaxID=3366139 RepID=UPI00380BF409